jgi:cytochrome b involved in lipid metabolism
MKENAKKSAVTKVWTYDELLAVKDEKFWMLYDGGVYDVRHFMPYHPGGELLIKHLLYTDATDHINKVHPEWVFTQKLPNYFIGTLDEKTGPPLRSKTVFSKKMQ